MSSAQPLADLISLLQAQIEGFAPLGNKRKKFCKQLGALQPQFATLEVPDAMGEIYDALIKKGTNLSENHFRISMNPKQLADSIRRYISYLYAAYGDFTGETSRLTCFHRLFLICGILIMLLSPFMIPPIFALVLVIPILMASRGIRNRTGLGFLLSLVVGAGGIITGAFWVKYLYFVLTDFDGMLADFLRVNSFLSQNVGEVLMIVLSILGALLFALTIWFLYKAFRVRRLFVQ